MMFVYARNNWNADWQLIEDAVVTNYETSDEELGRTFSFVIPTELSKMTEGVATTNRFRMYSEILIQERAEDGTLLDRSAGYIQQAIPRFPDIEYRCSDYLGCLNKTRADLGHYSADVKKIGTVAAPIALLKQTEDGEDRFIIDPTTGPEGYTQDNPVGPPYTNRRTWKAIGRVRDMGNDTNDYPDHVIPPAKYAIGSDLLNYLQFNSYIPSGTGTDIQCEFVVVYVEDTNQLEDIIKSILSLTDEAGPRLLEGVHFDSTSADYYTRTIWPSLITVNQWQWEEKDGTVAEAIINLLQNFAPPNFKVFQSGRKVHAQYVEQTPHDMSTSYYQQGSYPYGRIASTPPGHTGSDYITPIDVSFERTAARDEETFASKIVCYGKNEYPQNMLDLDMFIFEVSGVVTEPLTGDVYSNNSSEFTIQHIELVGGAGPIVGKRTSGTNDPSAFGSLVRVSGSGDDPIAYSDAHCMVQVIWPTDWPAGWTEDGTLPNLLDLDAGTYHRIWYDHNNSPPVDDYKNYQPVYFIDFGWTRKIEIIRLIMLWSRREYKFAVRVECHSDYTKYVYSADAPWEPLHKDLYEMEYDPYAEVTARGQFLIERCRFVRISMKPTKIHLRFRYAAGLSDMEFVEREDVKGVAYIVHSAPGTGYTHISGGTPGDPGEWYQHVGIGDSDGEVVCIMPALHEQLLSRADDPNKSTIGHRTEVVDNGSLANTNACAMEAARVLMETLREARPVGLTCPPDAKIEQYKTVRFFDPFWNTWRRLLVMGLSLDDKGLLSVTGVIYGSSETERGGAWTEEVPNAL